MNLDLTNKTALVCGSTQGLGFASAMELSRLGCSVILLARNEDKLKIAVTELDTAKGQKHNYLVADFSKIDEVKSVAKKFADGEISADILVNNTGGPPGGSAIEATVEEFVQAYSNHLLCNHILMQAVVPGMKKRGWGRIINVISTSVKIPIAGLAVSNTTRAAVANWAKTISVELGPFGITVNNVLPGFTETARAEYVINNKAEKTGKSKETVLAELLKEIPAGRLGQPEEFGAAVAFLASPAAGYINGINLPVDGGRTGSL